MKLDQFPTSGNFLIDCGQQNPAWCCFTIVYNGVGFVNPEYSYIEAQQNDNKAQYHLSETWFYDETNPTDGILVQGSFNEP
jgi:hypothetical protein